MTDLIEKLCFHSGLSERDVLSIIANAPVRYKTYEIPKRSGGVRIISQPSRELKRIQRIFLKHYLMDLAVHDSATAYRFGVSIKDNASPHTENGPILKLDFTDFFPSITASDWEKYCDENCYLSGIDLKLSQNILFHKRGKGTVLRLAIGAPSSPHLSNVLMRKFDIRISELLSHLPIKYTRYADDMTFSAPRVGYLHDVIPAVRKVIRDISYPKLKLNDEKTVLATKKFKRFTTGLVLADQGFVSIGRERKRYIRACIDHYKKNMLSPAEICKLSGLLSFAYSIEPEYVAKIEEKYGYDMIKRIKKFKCP